MSISRQSCRSFRTCRQELFSAAQRGVQPSPAKAASFSTSSQQRASEEIEPPKTKPRSPFYDLRRAPEGSLTQENSPQRQIQQALFNLAKERGVAIPDELQAIANMDKFHQTTRMPRSVQALYIAPLKRTPTHGIPVCNLQIRSYNTQNLEFMADFALRAAYYLNLPAKGPVPLPKIHEVWTVPRSVFVHKKSQENWERTTMRRLVQIQDGHPEVVQRWLAFIRQYQWYGVGMKADVWEYESMDVIENMDKNEKAVEQGLATINWDLFGRKEGLQNVQEINKFMDEHGFMAPPQQPKQASSSSSGAATSSRKSAATDEPKSQKKSKDTKQEKQAAKPKAAPVKES